MIILQKYYCTHCERFLKKREVVPTYFYGMYVCKYCHFEALETEKYIGKIISDYRNWENEKKIKVKVDLKVHHK